MLGPGVTSYGVLVLMLVLGGAIGATLAARVQMTSMPQLVAILHSFVGAAAVLVGFAITIQSDAQYAGTEALIHRVETFIGIFVGAVTFTGSVIAFGKLQGVIRSKPVLLPGRHALNLIAGTCAAPGAVAVSLGDITAGPDGVATAKIAASSSAPVVGPGFAFGVYTGPSASPGAVVACGDQSTWWSHGHK